MNTKFNSPLFFFKIKYKDLKKGFTYLSLFFFLASISCDNLVEVDRPLNQIDGSVVYESVQTANSALAGLYAGLFDNSPLSGDTTGPLLSFYTDDLDYYFTSTNGTGTTDIYLNQQLSNNSTILSYWTAAYQKIYNANAIIEGVNQSSALSTADKNRISGEALLVRSVIFYDLEELFGDIPYPISTDYNLNQSIQKTDKTEVLQKLGQDLLLSISLLNDTYRNTDRIYPNKKVAELVLAKIYMLQKKWVPAEQLLSGIIQSPLYSFQNDLSKVFTKSSPNIIWQLKPNNPTDPTKEIQYYYFTDSPLNALSSSLVNSFDGNDLRKTIYITTVTNGTTTWYRANKYKNRTNNTTEYSVIFRLEEVYLLFAEVEAQQDKVVEALPYINKTRQRAGLSPLPTNLTSQQCLTEILKEDRKEFFTEMGHRFFDLKRIGQLNTLQTTKPSWKTYNILWPLPQNELLLNPKLNPQNQGY